jgi:hypothetical protein
MIMQYFQAFNFKFANVKTLQNVIQLNKNEIKFCNKVKIKLLPFLEKMFCRKYIMLDLKNICIIKDSAFTPQMIKMYKTNWILGSSKHI